MNLKIYDIQLKDGFTGEIIQSAGGMFQVCVAGSPDKLTLYNDDKTSLANPVSMVRGRLHFAVDADLDTVDIHGISPTGHGFSLRGLKPGGNNEYPINTQQRLTSWVIPFSHADSTDNTEKDTGFDLPVGALVFPQVALDVVDTDATETILFGTLSSESGGDADGFGVGLSLATAGTVKATLLNSGVTLGAQLYVQDSANAGDKAPESYVVGTAKSVSYTTSAGTDTGSGFIVLNGSLANIV